MQEKRSCGQDRHCTGGDMCIYQSAEFEFFPLGTGAENTGGRNGGKFHAVPVPVAGNLR